jgi:hypothetical protein
MPLGFAVWNGSQAQGVWAVGNFIVQAQPSGRAATDENCNERSALRRAGRDSGDKERR